MNTLLAKLKVRLPAMLLLAVTLLFWGLYDRYEPAGPALLEQPGLEDAFKVLGNISETNGVFCLLEPAGGKWAEARFRLPGGTAYPFVRAQGRVRTENVVQGKRPWQCARLILIQRRSGGKWIAGHYSLHSVHGTVDWSPMVEDFELSPDAVSIELVLQHSGASGTAWFDSVSVVPVRIKPSHIWFKISFAFLWVGAAVLYYRRTRLDHRKLRHLILLNVLVILYGTLMPGGMISDATEKVKTAIGESIQKKSPERPTEQQAKGDKAAKRSVQKNYEQTQIGQLEQLVGGLHRIGHFVLFASLCFLVYCSAALEGQSAIYYYKVAFDLLLFSAISESLQYLTMDRTPGLSDWLMDGYGMLAAFLLFLILRAVLPIFPKSGKA